MALSFNWDARIVDSDASITDLPAFHAELRDAEDSEPGMVRPITHKWQALELGGGGFIYQADFINGWQLRFPAPGNYVITGNLNATILPVAGTFVERQTSAAYVTTAVGGSGPSAASIAAAVRAELTADLTRLMLVEKILRNKQITDDATGIVTVYDDDGSTVLFTASLFEDAIGVQRYRGKGGQRRERFV